MEPPEEPEDWFLNDLEGSWLMWTLLEAIEWRWPPDILEMQDEALMIDLATISWFNRRMKEQIDQAEGEYG